MPNSWLRARVFRGPDRLVNQLEVKAGRGTQFNDSRQVKGEDHRIFNLREVAHCSRGDRFNFVFLTRTLAPVFQRNERDTGVLARRRNRSR